jgi:nitroreductase
MRVNALVLSLACCFSIPCFSHGVVPVTKQPNSILPLFNQRHSGRAYDPSRSVSLNQLHLLAEAARSAPSSYNEQPWSFIICDRTTDPQAYDKAFSCLIEFNQNWAKNAPVLIIISANMQSEKTNKFNRWGAYDTGAAAISMALEAAAMGLMAHQMGGFDEIKIQKEFGIPAEYSPMAVMAVGYESADEAIHVQTKDRRSLNENFFMGSWGKGLEVKESKLINNSYKYSR